MESHVDAKSLMLCFITMFTGFISNLNSVVALVSIMVGLSTLLYNLIKIYKEVKSKKDGESN